MINSRKGFEKFRNKVNSAKKVTTPEFANGLAEEFAIKGTIYAENQYSGVSSSVTISDRHIEEGSYQVVAKDNSDRPHILFLEYGTGVRGKNSYPHIQVPQSNIPITGEYEHDYRYEEKVKAGENPKILTHWQGFEARAPMFYTMQDIRDNKVKIVREFMERERE